VKRLAIVALLLTLVLLPVGCGSGGSSEGGSTPTGDGSGGGDSASGEIATVEDLRAVIDSNHADAEWYPDLTDITLETLLGADAVVIHVSWGSANQDWETNNRKQQAIGTDLQAYELAVAPNMLLMDGDENLWPLSYSGRYGALPMAEAFALPAAPTTPDEMQAWLNTVYGPGGLIALGPDETWLSSIKSMTMGDYGSGPVLIVDTSIPTGRGVQWSLLQTALYTTGSSLMENYSITAADGTGLGGSAGGLSGPGANGLFYTP